MKSLKNKSAKLLMATVVCLTSVGVFAQNSSTINIDNKKEHRFNYEEFINHYGVDDTSIAIINIFFDKRENCASGKMSFLPLSAGIAALNAPIGIGLMAVSTPIFVSGTITRLKYNRKHLVKALVAYQNQNVMTTNLKRRVVTYLEIENEYRQEENAATQFALAKTINEYFWLKEK